MDTMVFTNDDEQIVWLDHTQSIDGNLWLKGKGNLPCDIMFVSDHPGKDEVRFSEAYKSQAGKLLRESLKDSDIDLATAYLTYFIKYQPKAKTIKAPDVKACTPALEEEIKRGQPRLLVTLGAYSLKAVMGRGYKLKEYRGTSLQHPEFDNIKVFPMYNPSYILRNPDAMPEWRADWNMLECLYQNKTTRRVKPEFVTVHSVEELRVFKEYLFSAYPAPFIYLDCEWEGVNYMEPGAYIRTVQLGYDLGRALILELFNEAGDCICTRPDSRGVMQDYKMLQLEDRLDIMLAMYKELKSILEAKNVSLGGHHLRADGSWLLRYGIDVRPNTTWDTMVCEHTIDSRGPFGLSDLTVKYTQMGRYDTELVDWKEAREHKKEVKSGFGRIPADILLPYGACDVDAPRRIAERQKTKVKPFTIPRGKYPSLWDIDMHTSKILYEPEQIGLLVDKERLAQFTKMYETARYKVEVKIIEMAGALNMADFNPRSPDQVKELLFDKLEMTPIKTTKTAGNRPWEWVLDQEDEVQAIASASTDKDTLAILADQPDANPIVGLLRDYRKVDYVCKTWLVSPEKAAQFTTESRGGGILSKIWPDGRLHARFSQLKETARFGTSKPNVQNWMKRAEGELKRIIGSDVKAIFGDVDVFPTLRSVVVATPGYVYIEADWKQAEMFVLSASSGDHTMHDALTTPGKDLHDTTAISAFGIQLLDQNGNKVDTEWLLKLAASDVEQYGTCEGHEFEKVQKTLIYLDQKGRKLTRQAFKDDIRVSAKGLNFGLPYGRGPLSIALQIKAETGTTIPIPQLQADIEQMMQAWKIDTYPDAWNYMQECAKKVEDPGYLINPWGRYRRFAPTYDKGLIRKYGREAQNFPIQSTVADTCLIALWMMAQYRAQSNLHFRIVNQIHDAIVLEVPEDEIDVTKQMLHETMGNIKIPIVNQPLVLDIDIDVMRRWGVK